MCVCVFGVIQFLCDLPRVGAPFIGILPRGTNLVNAIKILTTDNTASSKTETMSFSSVFINNDRTVPTLNNAMPNSYCVIEKSLVFRNRGIKH